MFNFDFVGNDSVSQSDIFTHIAQPIADQCLEGYNGSIFAYGQTGAGKTFTIQGPGNLGDEGVSPSMMKGTPEYENRGLMPRSFEYIF